MSLRKIGIIFGGRSGEHEVSLMSAASVIGAIDKNKYEVVQIGISHNGEWFLFDGSPSEIANGSWQQTAKPISIGDIKNLFDFALPILHGTFGEDGSIQGLFEMLDIPYAGCGVLASSMCMDKATAKGIFVQNGIPTCKYKLVYAEDIRRDVSSVAKEIFELFDSAVFVKPSNMGSSVGISKARNLEELEKALFLAAKFDSRILVEEAVNAREVETGVIGNFYPEVASVGEIVAASDFYDYEAKYSDDKGTVITVPTILPADTIEEIRNLAIKAYKALACEGYARIDFFVSKDNGKVYINEINTIPGFTKYSMFPSLWKEAGVEFTDLIERIVDLGYERYNDKNKRQTVYR